MREQLSAHVELSIYQKMEKSGYVKLVEIQSKKEKFQVVNREQDGIS